jgi:Domain of unknown function (DUF4173)
MTIQRVDSLTAPTRLGLAVLAGGLVIGLAADALLRVSPWGINFSLFTVACVVALAFVGVWQGISLRGSGLLLVIPAVLFGAAYAWRASPVLQALNLGAALLALALLALYVRGADLRFASLAEIAAGLMVHSIELYLGAFPAAFRVRWREVQTPRMGTLWALLRGLGIAVPIVLLFGKLLSLADPVFDALVLTVFRIDLPDLIVQLTVICVVAYFASGWLYRALVQDRWRPAFDDGTGLIGRTELVMALGAINVLFAAFVVIQLRYFFGGADVVAFTPGLTYSEYARRGFFELVWVAGLALPLLLLLDTLRTKCGRRTDVIFRVLAAATILLLFVVMVSAVQRMRLYVDEFGLTELRLYPTAFMAWLAIVFVWFGATVLRQRSRQFMFGAFAAGFVALAGLNLLNPDAFIARVNLDRPPTARPVDLDYLLSLSADAVPVLVDAVPTLSDVDRRTASNRLYARWYSSGHPDWRTFNVGRAAASESVSGL